MTDEEILQLLYEETLVGNAPVVGRASTTGSSRAWRPNACCSTR